MEEEEKKEAWQQEEEVEEEGVEGKEDYGKKLSLLIFYCQVTVFLLWSRLCFVSLPLSLIATPQGGRDSTRLSVTHLWAG